MSKERELLESCLDEFQYQSFPCTELVTRIKELLAQPEQDQIFKVIEKNRFNEGLMVGLESSNRTLVEAAEAKQDWLKDNERLTNLLLEAEDKIQELLAKPENKREPLSAETIAELGWNTYVVGTADSVRNFVRAIEKAHGIGE